MELATQSALISDLSRRENFIGAVKGRVAITLRLEGAVALIAATLAYRSLGGSWGQYFLLFLLPDLSMAGYLFNKRIGATLYNIGHSYISPAMACLIAALLAEPSCYGPALIWVAHIGFDRLLGYGLKYQTGFGDTHLGQVGRKS